MVAPSRTCPAPSRMCFEVAPSQRHFVAVPIRTRLKAEPRQRRLTPAPSQMDSWRAVARQRQAPWTPAVLQRRPLAAEECRMQRRQTHWWPVAVALQRRLFAAAPLQRPTRGAVPRQMQTAPCPVCRLPVRLQRPPVLPVRLQRPTVLQMHLQRSLSARQRASSQRHRLRQEEQPPRQTKRTRWPADRQTGS